MAKQVQFLGDFGESHEDIEYTFGWFGNQMRMHPESGQLDYMEFIGQAIEVDEENVADSYRLTMEFLKKQVHPDDWDVFWALAKKHRQSTEELMMTSQKLLAAASGFPTEQPSTSSESPPPRTKRSRARSSSTRAVSKQDNVIKAAFDKLEGRPDLKHAVHLAQTAAQRGESVG